MRLFLFLLLAYKANLNIGEPLPLKANLFRKQPHESWQKKKEKKKKGNEDNMLSNQSDPPGRFLE